MDKGRWIKGVDATLWDKLLASRNGHPLQSALWGDSRHATDGVEDLRLAHHTLDGSIDDLARIETRSIPLVGKVAWLPKMAGLADGLEQSLRTELKRLGFIACISDLYRPSGDGAPAQPKTIWLDLTLGLETLSRNLDQQWRYGARRAVREGVLVSATVERSKVRQFFQMCEQLSRNKGFALPGSEALMTELICTDAPSQGVEMRLYVGELAGELAGGAVVARCGRHLHYFWGASDRRFSKYRVSEAIQWQIIQDGVNSGMVRYDLEGIDPTGNPGVYQFKRKMGGCEVALQGMEATPLSWVGRVAVGVGRRLGRLG